MRWTSLTFSAACCVVVAAQAAAAEDRPVVSSVEIQGCHLISPDHIRFLLSTRKGLPLDREGLADDIRAIARMGPFDGISSELVTDKVDPNKVVVIFHVHELPLVGDVRFPTLDYFQRTGVEKLIQTKAGKTYLNPQLLDSDRQTIVRHFQDDGYRGVRVTVEAPVTAGVATVSFVVDLGHSVSIGQVYYRGEPPGVISGYLDSGIFNQPGKPYQPDVLDLDRSAITHELEDVGYLSARVDRPSIESTDYVFPDEARRRHGPQFVPDGRTNNRVLIIFGITPGALWHLGSVSFVDNTVATETELRTAFGLPDGVPFRRREVAAALERARRTISNQGYARANLRIEHRPDPATHLMHLIVHVFEGDLYTVQRVDINGNFQTKDAVIRRAMRISPGELWNDDALDDSKRQIARTGLFKSPDDPQDPLRIEPSYDDDQPGKVDLQTDVSEVHSGKVQLSVGYSSAFGLFGQVGYSESNFDMLGTLTGQNLRGAGQLLDMNVFVGQQQTSLTADWTNPHLFDGPYYFKLGGVRSDSFLLTPWENIRLSGSAEFGRLFLNDDLHLGLGYSYTDLRVTNVQPNAPNDALVATGHYFYNSVFLSQTYDRLDNARLPTSGYALNSYEGLNGQILPASADTFEYMAGGDVFIPLYTVSRGGKIILHFADHWKQIRPIGSTTAVPFYQRYYGGGESPEHRGFQDGGLSPHELNVNGLDSLVGGTTSDVLTGEVYFPITGSMDGLRLVLFSDVGNVWGQGEAITIGSLRTAVGFGIRFPVALPVALDFAWLLDPKSGESAAQIHFSLGFYAF